MAPRPPVDGWDSAAIPPTIRRPWRVFEEDLEDKVGDAASQGCEVDEEIRKRLAVVQTRGAPQAFASLPEDQQRTYAEVSLMELSAFVGWRRHEASRGQNADNPSSQDFEAAWDLLDCDDKAEWVPEDPRAALAADGIWEALLSNGPAAPESSSHSGRSKVVKPEPTDTAAAPSNEQEQPKETQLEDPNKGQKREVVDRGPQPPRKVVKQELGDSTSAVAVAPAKCAAPAAKGGAAKAAPPAKAAAKQPEKKQAVVKKELVEGQATVAAPPKASVPVPSASSSAKAAPQPKAGKAASAKPATPIVKKELSEANVSAPSGTTKTPPAAATAATAATAAAKKKAPPGPAAPTPAVAPVEQAKAKRTAVSKPPAAGATKPATQTATASSTKPASVVAVAAAAAAATKPTSRGATRRRPRKALSDEEDDDDDEITSLAARIGTSSRPRRTPLAATPTPTATPGGSRRESATKTSYPIGPNGKPLAPENLCPEALSAVCTVCRGSEASDENDLGLCDRCDKAFHQKCHQPPVERFGNIEDQWFCESCTAELAKLRGLPLAAGDFAWVKRGGQPPWPARVLRMDFASLADPKPYEVLLFDSDGSSRVWLNERSILPWSKGPPAASLKDPPRRAALQLAEADGAPPWTSKLPATRASTPTRATPDEPPAKRLRRVVSSGEDPTAVVAEPAGDSAANASSQVQPAQAAELRTIIEEAKRKQVELERQLKEAFHEAPPSSGKSPTEEENSTISALEKVMDKVIEEDEQQQQQQQKERTCSTAASGVPAEAASAVSSEGTAGGGGTLADNRSSPLQEAAAVAESAAVGKGGEPVPEKDVGTHDKQVQLAEAGGFAGATGPVEPAGAEATPVVTDEAESK